MVLRPPLIKAIILVTAIVDLAHNRGDTDAYTICPRKLRSMGPPRPTRLHELTSVGPTDARNGHWLACARRCDRCSRAEAPPSRTRSVYRNGIVRYIHKA